MQTLPRIVILAELLMFLPLGAMAQSVAATPTPPPQFSVYQGKMLPLTPAEAVKQINALSPIAYVDPQMTNDFTTRPVHDLEKISANAQSGHIEFWSDDSLDGMALESSFDVQWSQVCCRNIYVINNPENGQDYQIEGVTNGGFLIRNAFRNVDDAGHLAPLQQGDPDDMFTFDNSGDLPKAKHIADLLTTLIAHAANPAPQLLDTADRDAVTAGPAIAAPDPVTPVVSGVPAAMPPGAVVAPGVTLTDVAPQPQPPPIYQHPATSYFEGNFAVRVTPRQDGSAGVDVINISGRTHAVAVTVTACQNIAGGGCGAKFKGRLAPGMKLSFPIGGDDTTQPWDFHVDAAQNGA
jgi:hypothetical protein